MTLGERFFSRTAQNYLLIVEILKTTSADEKLN